MIIASIRNELPCRGSDTTESILCATAHQKQVYRPPQPLQVQTTKVRTHLALFRSDDFIPSTAIAFKASGKEFLAWKSHLENEGILMRCTDHAIAWSLYFKDPERNMHEITTYEHGFVASQLEA